MSVKLSRTELASLLGMGLPSAAPVSCDASAVERERPDGAVARPSACEVDETTEAMESVASQGRGATVSLDNSGAPTPGGTAMTPQADPLVSQSARAPQVFQDERHASAFLKKVLSGLWHKVEADRLTRSEQRERLLHLLQWAASKNGWQLQTSVAQRYAEVGRQVEGRLWVTLGLSEHQRFALELAFETRQAPLAKLHAARQSGWVPLLLMPGTKLLVERMEELHRTSGDERLAWLQVLALNRPA